MLIDFITTTGVKIIVSVVLLVIGLKLIKLLLKVVSKSEAFIKIDPSAQSFIRSFISIALKIILGVSLAGYLGLEMTSVLAVLASAGLALGLALQGALGNLAGGMMILIFKPFRVGDFIDANGDSGTVTDINIFYTVLNTVDNKRIMMPNGALTNASITNFSMEDKRRVDLKFTTDYSADVEKVKAILIKLASEHELTITEPIEPFCRLGEHGDSSLVFVLRVWTLASDYWTVYFDLMEQVKVSFDQEGIEIPYPQMDVHLNSLDR